MRYLLLALLLVGCGSGDVVSTAAPPSVAAPSLAGREAAARQALSHILLRPGLISLTEGLVAIRELTLRSRAVPGPKAGYIDVVGDRFTFVNWTAEAEEVNGTVTFVADGQDYAPGFTYAALDGSVRDVIAAGTARLREGVWTLDVDTTETVSGARTVTHGLRFTKDTVNGEVALFLADLQGVFTVTTASSGVVTASSSVGTVTFPSPTSR